MKIFAISSNVPYRHHDVKGVTSVHIFTHALLDALVRQGHHIVLQVLFNEVGVDEFEHERSDTASRFASDEERELSHFRRLGVETLPPVFGESDLVMSEAEAPHSKSLSARAVGLIRRLSHGGRVEDYYPTHRFRSLMDERIRACQPDIILTLCSPEGLAAVHGLNDIPKVAHHGDIDFVPTQMRLRSDPIFGLSGSGRRGIAALLRQELGLAHFKQAHFRLMKEVDVIGNLTASNAPVYTRRGHPRSVYTRNTWPVSEKERVDIARIVGEMTSPGHTIKIIGHLGYLNRTGSAYGIDFLMASLPVLDRVMKGLDYQIHIIGAGDAPPRFRPLFEHPHVVSHGYEDNLDDELATSDVFLLLNNAGPYQAVFTRHLVAWSYGLCLLAHAKSALAIPEIRHMENVLAASTPEQLAHNIHLASTDPALNRRIREGGRRTFLGNFTPDIVARRLMDSANEMLNSRRTMVE